MMINSHQFGIGCPIAVEVAFELRQAYAFALHASHVSQGAHAYARFASGIQSR